MKHNVLDYLEESALRFPNKTAFADESAACTFAQLKERAQTIGSALAREVPAGMPVPIFMEKSVDTIALFLGCVYAGCFYCLLDVKQPSARIHTILETLQASVAVTVPSHLNTFQNAGFSGRTILLEELEQQQADRALLQAVRERMTDTSPLYCNFTSGSTGVPKGVVVSHRSVLDFIDVFTDLFSITQEDVIGNQAPWDFDVSVKDIYSGLKTGACVQIIPRRMFSFPVQLLDFLCERHVTTLIWAVSALCMISGLKGFEYRVPDSVQKVLFSGEVMPIRHLTLWQQHLPDARFVNLYGPTEITCNCTYYEVDRTFFPGESLPIGKSFPNEHVFLLDGQDREITDANITGELCVAGTCLALGYYNNAAQTAKVFTDNPLCPQYPERIYRTGDLAYYGEDGLLYFASRKDFQIKHMGHRIELGEVEAALESLPGMERACCLFDERRNKLSAFCRTALGKREITRGLAQILPPFMIPNQFFFMEDFPLNKNGKIDRQKLKNDYLEVDL